LLAFQPHSGFFNLFPGHHSNYMPEEKKLHF
jgi:hypothetical protein